MSLLTHTNDYNDTDDFNEHDLLEDMEEDTFFDPDEIYSDVYDFPELLVPIDELQGEL